MKKQLLELMESESMTPAKFADEIGVQRSSISHILSDRNKPSYDFILKILNRFPKLNAEWLISGQGPMNKAITSSIKDVKQTSLFDSNVLHNKNSNQDFIQSNEIISENIKKQDNVKKEENIPIQTNKLEFTNVNNIKLVMLFYNDGTFEQFNPR